MAINPAALYPGGTVPPNASYPYGSAKDVTAPGTGDGTPLRAAWVNDWFGFQQAVMGAAGVTPSGSPDTAQLSQIFNAITSIIRNASSGVVGLSRNAKINITAASSTAIFTADEVVVETALGGQQYRRPSINKTINIATTGVNGMDTGSPPVTGFLAVYAIYNPTTNTDGLLGVNATSSVVTEVYSGANMPSGYTASALVAILPVATSQFAPSSLIGRNVYIPSTSLLSGSSAPGAVTPLVITAIPLNAVSVDLSATVGIVSNDTTGVLTLAASSGLVAGKLLTIGAAGTGGTISSTSNLSLAILSNARTLYYRIQSATLSYGVSATGYSF